MKIGMLFVAGLVVTASSCLAGGRTIARDAKPAGVDAKPVITGLEDLNPDIQAYLRAEGFDMATDGDAISVSDNGYEKIVLFDTESALRVVFFVQNENDGYNIEIEMELAHDAGSLESLLRTDKIDVEILQSNPELIKEAVSLALLRKAIDNGDSSMSMAMQQLDIVGDNNTGYTLSDVTCVSNNIMICCIIEGNTTIRIICICSINGTTVNICKDKTLKK